MLLIGATGVIVCLCVGVTALLLVSSEKIWSKINTQEVTQGIQRMTASGLPVSDNQSGVFERSVLAVASYYLQTTIQQVELRHHVAALSCLESLGGPSPNKVLEVVKSKINSPDANASLESLKTLLEPGSAPSNRAPGACINWMFNS
jgi:hypothetical protein